MEPARLSLNLFLNGRKIQINIACISQCAKNEIESLLSKPNIDIKDILKAYIQKTQDYAELESRLESITEILSEKID